MFMLSSTYVEQRRQRVCQRQRLGRGWLQLRGGYNLLNLLELNDESFRIRRRECTGILQLLFYGGPTLNLLSRGM
jgi:hypothetical protein